MIIMTIYVLQSILFTCVIALLQLQTAGATPLPVITPPTIKPDVSTTSTSNSKTDVFATSPLCPNKMDIVLAIDSSGSVTSVWREMIDDAQIFASNFQVSETMTRMAIIDFSAVANVYTPLDANNTDEGIYQKLEKMDSQQQNGESWVELGFDRANDMFRSANPPRDDVRKVLVMYTDGDLTSGDHDSLKDMIKSQQSNNIEHYIVKVKNGTQKVGMEMMKGAGCKIYQMQEPPAFGQPSVEDAVCFGSGGQPLVPVVQTTSSTPLTPPPQESTTSAETSSSAVIKTTAATTVSTKDPREFCLQKADPGVCFAYIQRYFYNATSEKCEIFIYGGCGGNENNFGSLRDCYGKCEGVKLPNVIPTPPLSTRNTMHPPINKKCLTEKSEAEALIKTKVPTLVQVFVPECDEDGNYKPVQHHEGTNIYWCVDIETGDVVNGSKTEGLILNCNKTGPEDNPYVPPSSTLPTMEHKVLPPKSEPLIAALPSIPTPEPEPIPAPSVDYEHPKNPCAEENDFLRQRYNLDHAKSEEQFYFECDGKELFQPLQKRVRDNERWCVDKKTGAIVTGTKRTGDQPDPVCDGERAPMGIQTTPSPDVFPMPEPKDIPTPKPNDIRYPKNGCHEENDFISQRETTSHSKNGMLLDQKFVFYFQCERNGDYKPMQINAGTGEKWCVNTKNGNIIEGTSRAYGQPDPVCEEGLKSSSANTSVGAAVADDAIFKPQSSCNEENTKFEEREKENNNKGDEITLFKYGCDLEGNYKPLQYDGLKQVQWCVNPMTGHLIEGKKLPTGQPLDCSQETNMKYSGNQIASSSMGQTTGIKPSVDQKIHNDKYHPNSFNCNNENAKIPPYKAGAMRYNCEDNGNFKPMQSHGSTGERWCVNSKSGNIIQGTLRMPGQPDPDCLVNMEHVKATGNDTNDTNTPDMSVQQLQPVNVTPGLDNPFLANVTVRKQNASDNGEPSKTDTTFYPYLPCNESYKMNVTNTKLPIRYIHLCEENGDYKILQMFSQLQLRWCVSSKTGHLISGTLYGPGQTLTEQDCQKANAVPESESRFYGNHNITHSPPAISPEGEELLGLSNECEYKIGDKYGPQSNLKKLGCFNDIQQPPRPFPIMILDETNITVDAPYSKDEWSKFIKGFVCKCAKETRKRGFFTFGIQNYAQCYSGPDEGRYAEDREAAEGMCINEDQEPCKTDDKQFCAGIEKQDPHTNKTMHANFVYMIMTETHQEIKYIEYDRKKRSFIKKRKSQHVVNKRFMHHYRKN